MAAQHADIASEALHLAAQLGDEDAAPLRPRTFSATSLLTKDFPDPRWAVPEVIPDGATLLIGAPKKGKSWLLLGLALAIAAGGRALGKIPVEQGDVLVLALEDNPRRLQERMLRVLDGESAPARLHFATEWPRIDQGGLEWLDSWLSAHPEARLVGVDVIARIRPPVSGLGNGNSYGLDYAALAALKEVADAHGVALVAVHHSRKAPADDPFDTISGTNGLAAAADTTLILTRETGRADGNLYLRGRDVREAEHALSFDPVLCTWSLLGDAAEYRLADRRFEILQLLRERGPLGPKAIAESLDANRATIRSTLARMLEAGQLEERNGIYQMPCTGATAATDHVMTPNIAVAGLHEVQQDPKGDGPDEPKQSNLFVLRGGGTTGVQQACNNKNHVTTPDIPSVAPVAPLHTPQHIDVDDWDPFSPAPWEGGKPRVFEHN